MRGDPGTTYPFTAIVAQEEMKLGLVLSVIDPHIGGVLLMGHRGTGKSTAVRALADVLPPLKRVKGCVFGCDPEDAGGACPQCASRMKSGAKLPVERATVPVIELPLGATEDRVCGSLDIEKALGSGVKAFEPGLLARANRGFLYIDEVNLLEDHLVDLLLDVAASGRHVVEREGVSLMHPARFVLAGSGNPEEGEIRPQLLDRFGLYVNVETVNDLDARVEIMRRRERFERDGEEFRVEMATEQAALRRRIERARRLLEQVRVEAELVTRIAAMCLELNIAGHRGELTVLRASKAVAAFEGRKSVGADDVRRVAAMSLRHRVRRDVHGEMDFSVRIAQALERGLGGGGEVVLGPVDAAVRAEVLDAQARRPTPQGRPNGKVIQRPQAQVAMAATVAVAAGQARRPALRDLRYRRAKVDERKLVIFVVDASGSMAVNRVREAKGAVRRLLREAYWRRHKIAVITFRAGGAQLLVPPGRSIERASCAMDGLAVGGGTPLAAGLRAAVEVARREERESLLVLLTDGCANQASDGREVWQEVEEVCAQVRKAAIPSVVIDTRQPMFSRGEGKRLAALLGGRHECPRRLDADGIVEAVKAHA